MNGPFSFEDLLPTPLELTCSIPFGTLPADGPAGLRPRSQPRTSHTDNARSGLEESVLQGLRRPPCVVSFSGGCDSSLVLALAVHVARREGLPDPVPVTNVFPSVESSHETAFQVLVLKHLGLRDWERLVWEAGELEVVGPRAEAFINAVGVRLPFNAHFHEPIFQAARGGAVLTGIGGDDVLDVGNRVDGARLMRLHAPGPGHRRSALGQLLPGPLRAKRAVRARRFSAFPWLRPEARLQLESGFAAWEAEEPLHQGRALQWFARSRLIGLGLASRAALGRHHDVHSIDPLLSEPFLERRARELGPAGGTPRPRTLRHLAGDLLPDALLDRSDKAALNGAFFGHRSRAFALSWDGSGIDHELVDGEALRREWLRAEPDAHSFCLLQMAYAKTLD